jgi:hypothetical protein
MQIDLLYFEDCPSWQAGLENLKSALQLEELDAGIRMVLVESKDESERLHFLGSPSFQVDGVDLWPDERQNYALSCRVYATPQGMRGVPTVEMLREKLQFFKKS